MLACPLPCRKKERKRPPSRKTKSQAHRNDLRESRVARGKKKKHSWPHNKGWKRRRDRARDSRERT